MTEKSSLSSKRGRGRLAGVGDDVGAVLVDIRTGRPSVVAAECRRKR